MTSPHKHKVAGLILIQAGLCFFSAAHPNKSVKGKTLPATRIETQSHNFVIAPRPRIPRKILAVVGSNTINWASWSKFNGLSAVGTIGNAGKQVDVSMTANYEFDSIPDIFKHSMFANYPITCTQYNRTQNYLVGGHWRKNLHVLVAEGIQPSIVVFIFKRE